MDSLACTVCEGHVLLDVPKSQKDKMSIPNHRLVSLWEMLEHKAAAFFRVTTHLTTYEDIIRNLSLNQQLGLSGPTSMQPEVESAMLDRLAEFRAELERLGCALSVKQANRFQKTVESKVGWMQSIQEAFTHLKTIVEDELAAVEFFAIEPSKRRYFAPDSPLYGADVAAKFPSLQYEIDEAGKCLALERSTAAAFHAIRCLEGGIAAMSKCLAIPDPTKGADRNWGAMLQKIDGAIKAKWPTAASRFAGRGKTFEELYAVLTALQNPYRNGTMHFDQKYTNDEAGHIFDMIGGVMKKIASEMDESGVPLA